MNTKNLKQLYKELSDRLDFMVDIKGFDGGKGHFISGSQKGMTVIWSYGGGWEHISVDGKNRMPTWEEMCQLKDMFFNDDECCVQYHPPKSEYVNNIPCCLHIGNRLRNTVEFCQCRRVYLVLVYKCGQEKLNNL